MEVIQVLDRPASQSFYAVAGRLLFVESVDLRLANLIEQLFAGWQLAPVVFPERAPDILIKFFCGDSLPEIPHHLNQFEIAEGGQCYTDGADFYLALGASLIHLKNGNPITVSLWLERLPGARDPMLARAASFAVCAALRRCGLFDLHSAGVVNPDNQRAVLIVGPSGSGKSTLALQLARAGWPYLSDDEMLLSLVDGEVEARGFRNFFAVKDQANGPFKTCFEPEAVFASERRASAVPGLLLFIAVSGEQKSEFKTLTQPETMMRLIRACPWATYDTWVAAANLEVLSRLARQTSAFDLFAGRDLLEPQCASDLLSRLS
jgi:hypothetical protein